MSKLIVDFSDVERGGGRVRVPEDDYRAKVTGIKAGESKAGNSMLTWEFTGTRGKLKGKKLKDYTTFTKDSLWKLLGLLEALGEQVPAKKTDLTPVLKRVMGQELGITVGDDEYEGKISSKIQDYISLETLEGVEDDEEDDEDEDTDEDEDEGEDDEDEAPPPKSKSKKKKGKKKAKPADDDDEIEDLDLDEL